MAKELTSKSYIDHHLTNLTCGKTESVGWTCDHNYYDEMGFMAFHVDSISICILFFPLVLCPQVSIVSPAGSIIEIFLL